MKLAFVNISHALLVPETKFQDFLVSVCTNRYFENNTSELCEKVMETRLYLFLFLVFRQWMVSFCSVSHTDLQMLRGPQHISVSAFHGHMQKAKNS